MKTMNIIQAIKKAENFDFINSETQLNINKLYNIKKTAQFELMEMTDEKCHEVIKALEQLESEINSTSKRCRNIKQLRPEYIAINSPGDTFI